MRPHSLALQSLISHLASLPGVQRVVVDERQTVVVAICDRASVHDEVLAAGTEHRNTLGLTDVELEVVFRGGSREGKRIRFLGVTRGERPDHSLQVTVSLEWEGREVAASAQSERGEPPELRAVALATIEAVSLVVGQQLQLRVGGVKRVRSFDADLMVASLFRTGAVPQQLVGAVVAGDDPHSAACRAVLNGLNRLLGNYLSR